MILRALKALVSSVWKFALVLALLLGVLAFLGQGLTDASLEEFYITGLQEVSAESFTFTGELAINNPSLLPIPLQDVSYALYHEQGARFSNGTISSFVLRPGVSSTQLTEQVEWVPSAQLAADLLLEEEVWVTINGSARINLPLIREITIPFEDRFDVREYVTQFVIGAQELSEVTNTGQEAIQETTQEVPDADEIDAPSLPTLT